MIRWKRVREKRGEESMSFLSLTTFVSAFPSQRCWIHILPTKNRPGMHGLAGSVHPGSPTAARSWRAACRWARGPPRSRGEAAPPCRSGRREGICSWRWSRRGGRWNWGKKHEEHVTGGSTGKSIKSITCETQWSLSPQRSVAGLLRMFRSILDRELSTLWLCAPRILRPHLVQIGKWTQSHGNQNSCILTYHNIGVNIWLGLVFLLVEDPVMAAHKFGLLEIFGGAYCHLVITS